MEKREVLLVNPISEYRFDPFYVDIPLGLLYLATVLEDEGISVKIVDLQVESVKKLIKIVKLQQPRIIGISSLTSTFPSALRIAESCKSLLPEAFVVMGGPHVTFRPYDALKFPYVDAVVRGEGEITFKELSLSILCKNSIDNKIRGISFKKGKKIVSTPSRLLIPNLDILPYPRRELLPLRKYVNLLKKVRRPIFQPILASRGCPYNCIFCVTPKMWGKIRYRSVENVIGELKYIQDNFSFDAIKFVDDTLTFDKNYLLRLCKAIKASKLNIKWYCTGARLDNINEEILKEMKASGCYKIYYGAESASDKILKFIRKGFKADIIEKVVKLTEKIGIEVAIGFVVGFPNETRRMALQTIKLARKFKSSRISFLTPYPGSEIFTRRRALGLRLITRDWSKFTCNIPVMETKYLKIKDLCELYLMALEGALNFKHLKFLQVDKPVVREIIRRQLKPGEGVHREIVI